MKERIVSGITFKEGKPMSRKQMYETVCYPNIYKAYNAPSRTKVEIWMDWVQKLFSDKKNNGSIWVMSRNSHVFTIGAHLETPYGSWFIEIYPTRQIAHVLVD